MAHARQQVRAAVASALTGLTTTGTNVATGVPWPTDDEALPALRIFTPSEIVETTRTSTARLQRRLVTVQVQAQARGAGAYNTVDTIAAEVEAALLTDITLSGVLKDLTLDETEIEVSGDSDQRSARATLTFSAVVHTAEAAPETLA